MISISHLKDVLSYDQATGVFTWVSISKYHSEKNGDVAGCTIEGYINIKIDSIRYKAHRLAWFYVFGCWPFGIIDHINGKRLDNRISNLRDVPIFINAQNHKEKIKGNGLPTGVSFHGDKFRSRISVNKRKIFLGVFDTVECALLAYRKARKKYHDAPVMSEL